MTKKNITPSNIQKYYELVALTQQYLKQEYTPESHKIFTPEAYSFFSPYLHKTPSPKSLPPSEPIAPLPPRRPLPSQPSPQKVSEPLPSPSEPEKAMAPEPPADNFKDLQELYQKFAKPSPVYRGKVVVIALQPNAKEQQFLTKVTDAISDKLNPATLVDEAGIIKAGGTKALSNPQRVQAVIISKKDLDRNEELKKTLSDNDDIIPLIVMEDISQYLNNRSLKAELWDKLCQTLRS
ncbi:MAG: hypothetical protein ACQEP8_05385 [Chlamydiota bacterium]